MHKNNVAHRGLFLSFLPFLLLSDPTSDCTSNNILMDGASLYRVPFYPVAQDRKRNFSGQVHARMTRTDHNRSVSYKDVKEKGW